MIDYLELEQRLRAGRKHEEEQARLAEERKVEARKRKLQEQFEFESKKFYELLPYVRNFIQKFTEQARKLDCGDSICLWEYGPQAENGSWQGVGSCMRLEIKRHQERKDRDFLRVRFISHVSSDGSFSGTYELTLWEQNYARSEFEPFVKSTVIGTYSTVEQVMIAIVSEIAKR